MLAERKKWVLALFTVACVVGAGVLIWVGSLFFQKNRIVFLLFSLYSVLVTGVVIFFGFRLIGFQFSEKE
jgi:hypothetical protein